MLRGPLTHADDSLLLEPRACNNTRHLFNTTKRDKMVIYQKIIAFKSPIAHGRVDKIKVLNYRGNDAVHTNLTY